MRVRSWRRGLSVAFPLLIAGCIGDGDAPLMVREAAQSAARLPPLTTLAPAGEVHLQQNVPVNVVLMGFGGRVDPAQFRALLTPLNGVAQSRDDGSLYLGQRFDFQYNVVVVPQWFEDGIFEVLRAWAAPQNPVQWYPNFPALPITASQLLYSYCNLDPASNPATGCSLDPGAPRLNARTITQNYLLDATATEALFTNNLWMLGVDVNQPTVVLMNWYGRPDYVDHVYLSVDEPDPETGVRMGSFESHFVAGTGGTPTDDAETCAKGGCVPHRLWFHDLSAGPFSKTGTWDLKRRTVGYLTPPDYPIDDRLAHTADYDAQRPRTYRTLDTLTADLAERLVNDVYLSELAFAGPIYPAGLTPPNLPRSIYLDLHRWDFASGEPMRNAGLAHTLQRLSVMPYTFTGGITVEREGHDSPLGRAWDCMYTAYDGTPVSRDCPGSKPFYFGDAHLFAYFDGPGQRVWNSPIAADYRLPIFSIQFDPFAPLRFGGLADNNHRNPLSGSVWAADFADFRQTFIYETSRGQSQDDRGLSYVNEHEVGHHLGLAHPFMGYRCLDERCSERRFYRAWQGTFYSWSADYSAGLMNYLSNDTDFSQFERDNVRRNLTWWYLTVSNDILRVIAESPRADAVAAQLVAADAHARNAVSAYRSFRYDVAVVEARAAYDGLVSAAGSIRVVIDNLDARFRHRRDPAQHHGDFAEARRREIEGDGMLGTSPPPSTPDGQRSLSGARVNVMPRAFPPTLR